LFLIPAAAQLAGAAGTNWRTDLEVVNPGTAQAAFTVALLKHDSDNSSPQTKSYTLEGGRAVRYTNVLSSMFGFSGKGTLRLTVTSGAVLASSRTYNVMTAGNPLGLPAGATFGQYVPAVADSEVVGSGSAAYLIQLTHTPNPFTNQREGFRTNLGYVNATAATISLTVELYRGDGVKLGSYNDSLPAYGYKQVDKVFERVTSTAVTDGYAVVRTTTAGGAFLAYASVVDNVVGDPVFIPHRKVAGGTSPTPTPTTLPAGTRPLGTIETANDIIAILGAGGSGGFPTIEQVVRDVQQDGIEAVLNDLVTNKPNLVSRVPSGIRVSYGSGYRTQQGDLLTGTVTATYSNLSVTSSRVTGNYAATFSNFTKNDGYATIQTVSGAVDLNVTAAGKVSGSVTIDGSGSSPVGATTISGTVQVNTSTCAKYPIGGTVTIRRGSETKTITFTQSCDGSFQFTGPALDHAYFELRPRTCDGAGYAPWGVKIGLAADSGALTVDPKCLYNTGIRDHRASGTLTGTSATLHFRSWIGNEYFYQGTFQGTSTNGVYYRGNATYTVTEYNSNGTVRCTSQLFTAPTNDVWLNKLPYSYCD